VRFECDPQFRAAYHASEKKFLATVRQHTDKQGVSIFVDYIGASVYRATLRALSRHGVITTAGWKTGMQLQTQRAVECINWHTHVHTHYARRQEAMAAVEFAEAHDWMPDVNGHVYDWDTISELADDYGRARIADYFPLFQVNSL
jgi:NADPH:quinone reductase-like Zn-dependent oxidoreductase